MLILPVNDRGSFSFVLAHRWEQKNECGRDKVEKKEKSKREITDEAVETTNHVVGVKQRPVRRLHAAYRPAHP